MTKSFTFPVFLFIALFSSIPSLICQTLLSSSNISGSWTIVDIQGLEGTKLTSDEQLVLGNTWYFLPNEELLIQNDKGTYLIALEQESNQLKYLNRTISIEKKEDYRIDLQDIYKGRKVLVSLRLGEPLTKEQQALALDMRGKTDSIGLTKYGFDFSFEAKDESVNSSSYIEKDYKKVDEMPRFTGCEDQYSLQERKTCSTKKLLAFIYKNIKYPSLAREYNIEGTVVITFVIEKEGHISGARIVRDIGEGCGEEALRVVNLMNSQNIKWIPGKQGGIPVRVQFNLPVKFKTG